MNCIQKEMHSENQLNFVKIWMIQVLFIVKKIKLTRKKYHPLFKGTVR